MSLCVGLCVDIAGKPLEFCRMIKMTETVCRGRIEIQNNWDELLRKHGATATVNYKHPDSPVIRSKLKCVMVDGKVKIVGEDGFEANISEGVLNLSFSRETVNASARILPPTKTFTKVHKPYKIINDLDVTKGGIGASCDGENNVFIWTTDNGDVMRSLLGHKGEVYCCKFHPVELTLVTGSADMSLKMWNVTDASCVATFVGHTKGVTDFVSIEEGQKIVSVSKDGSAKIWDCSSSQCLSTLKVDEEAFLNSCFVGPKSLADGGKENILFVGANSGHVISTGLNDGQTVFDYDCGSPVLCCSSLSDQMIICGTQDCRVCILDLRNVSKPVICLKESRSSITSFLPHQGGCYITTGDGSAYHLNDKFDTTLELSGPEYGCLSKIVADSHNLYTGGKDGAVRKYAARV